MKLEKYSKKAEEYKKQKLNLRELLCILININTKQKTKIIDEEITIRENNIYTYNSRMKIRLNRIINNEDIMSFIDEKELKDSIVKQTKEISDPKIGLESFDSRFRGIYNIENIPENKIIAGKVLPNRGSNKLGLIRLEIYRDSIFKTVKAEFSGERNISGREYEFRATFTPEKYDIGQIRSKKFAKEFLDEVIEDYLQKSIDKFEKKAKRYRKLQEEIKEECSAKILSEKIL